ncbi:unnamed protein product [Amoebophrya sp. A25]|nr:unnamed protein product [Amoebophrya sp. A25]|eukprot:GSA25T00011860001.1
MGRKSAASRAAQQAAVGAGGGSAATSIAPTSTTEIATKSSPYSRPHDKGKQNHDQAPPTTGTTSRGGTFSSTKHKKNRGNYNNDEDLHDDDDEPLGRLALDLGGAEPVAPDWQTEKIEDLDATAYLQRVQYERLHLCKATVVAEELDDATDTKHDDAASTTNTRVTTSSPPKNEDALALRAFTQLRKELEALRAASASENPMLASSPSPSSPCSNDRVGAMQRLLVHKSPIAMAQSLEGLIEKLSASSSSPTAAEEEVDEREQATSEETSRAPEADVESLKVDPLREDELFEIFVHLAGLQKPLLDTTMSALQDLRRLCDSRLEGMKVRIPENEEEPRTGPMLRLLRTIVAEYYHQK